MLRRLRGLPGRFRAPGTFGPQGSGGVYVRNAKRSSALRRDAPGTGRGRVHSEGESIAWGTTAPPRTLRTDAAIASVRSAAIAW